MYSLNYIQCSLNNIREWHSPTTKFADSTNFFFSVRNCAYLIRQSFPALSNLSQNLCQLSLHITENVNE